MFIQKKNIYIDMQNQGIVESSSKVDLVILVYDRIILELRKLSEAIERKDIQTKIEAVSKSTKLIELGLLEYLDLSQGEVAENLKNFYTSAIFTITEANLKNKTEDLAKTQNSFIILRDAWKELSSKQLAWRDYYVNQQTYFG